MTGSTAPHGHSGPAPTKGYGAGRHILGWHVIAQSVPNGCYHVKTDMWGGGSPHGNSDYIMGGWHIKGYRPSQFRGTPDCNESAALHSYGLDAHCR